MTVRELIALLKEAKPDATVFFEDQFWEGDQTLSFDVSGIEYDGDEVTLTNAL